MAPAAWRAALACLTLLAAAAARRMPYEPLAEHQTQDPNDKTPWIELLSWKPRAYLYHHFMTDDECDHIIKVASPHIQRSSVVNADGSVTDDPIRTSWGTFLQRGQDEVIYNVEHRLAAWMHVPVEHAEDMQVLKYQNNQTYGAHWDDLDLDENPAGLGGGSVRVATVMLYLSDAEFGGETSFPHSRWLDKEKQTAGLTFSDCAKDGVAALPRKGNAVLFWNTKPGSGKQDKYSMHAGCPVIKGTKWAGVKWIHAAPFGGGYPQQPLATAGASLAQAERLLAQKLATKEVPLPACNDDSEQCQDWAKAGECTANAAFMREQCRLSCGVCCPEGDVLCERRRRRFVPQD
ncbi:hypothetical protein D9Q98_003857 [Chlorella vulgaris]|uniref:Procollagen-proline 4-dioxygenase n=1 Tax=Chlorella vulgaris TaxID=3077 RepID=A0A9D4YYH1_CHLVU|nr:hypothetical protein D9Q98_003857 [Chlorella vulgaris]